MTDHDAGSVGFRSHGEFEDWLALQQNVIPFPVKPAAPVPTAQTYKPTHGGYPDPKDKQ
jgi:hypothetical protein